MARRSNTAIMALADAYAEAYLVSARGRQGSGTEQESTARAALAKALEGRKPRAAGGRFERRVAKDLKAALGEGWTVTRNQTDRQKGQDGRSAGEFTVEYTGQTGKPTMQPTTDRGSGLAGRYTAPVFPFCIECKDVGTFRLAHLWKSPVPGPLASTPKAEGFWAQAVRQAEAVGKRPMLVWRDVESGTVLCAVHDSDGLNITRSGAQHRAHVDGERLRVMRWLDVVQYAGRWVE